MNQLLIISALLLAANLGVAQDNTQPPATPPPADNPQTLDPTQVNRFFRDLEGLSTGLDLRVGQAENDGSASGEAQAIEAITQSCEHKFEESQAKRTDSLSGDVCPVSYNREQTVVSASQGVAKIKITTSATVKEEPALSLSTLRSDVATTDITITDTTAITAFVVGDVRTVSSTALGEIAVKRVINASQSKANGAERVVVGVETSGGFNLKASIAMGQDKDGNDTATCKMDGQDADCLAVAYLLGMVDDEQSTAGGETSQRPVPVIQRSLKRFIK